MSFHRVPILRDDFSFQDRQSRLFNDMQHEMDRNFPRTFHSSPFENDFDRMCGDFMQLHPRDPFSRVRSTQGSDLKGSRESLDEGSLKSLFIEDPKTKSRMFQMSFDVHEYDPREVSVKVHDDTMVIEAKHEQDKSGNKVINEFSRKIKIPNEVDSEKLQSVMSKDGILTISAPVPPNYKSVTDGGRDSPKYIRQSNSPVQMQSLMHGQAPSTKPTTKRITPQYNQPAMNHPEPVLGIQSPSSSKNTPVFTQKLYMVPTSPQRDEGVPVTVKSTPVRAKTPPLDTPTFYNTERGCELVLLMNIGPNYEPDDLVVKVDGRNLTIEAEHIENTAGKKSKSSFSKQFELSELVDPNSVTAMLKDGRLKINGLSK